MEKITLGVRITKQQNAQLQNLVEKGYYLNRNDAIRTGITHIINKHQQGETENDNKTLL